MDHFLAGIERRAFRMAHFATGNDDEALDIVQDSMVKLVQRYADRPEAEWGPLFHRILQSRITDWHRRTWVRHKWRVWLHKEGPTDQTDGEDPIQQLPDPQDPDPAQRLEQSRAMAALDQALRKLPHRQRQAFLLRAWEGFDIAQTAHAMGCSEGSVKTHYSRAVHALRHQLKGYAP